MQTQGNHHSDLFDSLTPDAPLTCPDCGNELRSLPGHWDGVPGCLCTWGGRVPSVDDVVAVAEAMRRPWH